MTNREIGNEPETIISASVKLEGDFASQGNVLIEGEVEGSLKTEKFLRVGERARIGADVAAASATVAGEIRGNIDITDRLELESTAKVFGDIKTSDLVVASGAVICGRITMGADGAPAAKSSRSGRSAKATERVESSQVEFDEAEEPEEVMASAKETTKKVNAFFTR
ncbi:MAG: polymer-forming cytoskeletal protein [bacterium]